MTKQEIAKLFGCSIERLNEQYASNTKTLLNMRDKALKTGKKQGNLTAGQLDTYARKYAKLAQ